MPQKSPQKLSARDTTEEGLRRPAASQPELDAREESSFTPLTAAGTKAPPQVTRANIVALQQTLGNQTVMRLLQDQKAARPASTSSSGAIQRDDFEGLLSGGHREKTEKEEMEDAIMVEQMLNQGPAVATAPAAPKGEKYSQTSAIDSGLGAAKNIGGSFSPGLNTAVSAETLGAPKQASTAAIVGAKQSVKSLGKDTVHQAESGVRDNVVSPAKGLVSGAGGGHHAAGALSSFWSTLKEWTGKGLGWLQENIHHLFTFLEPLLVAIGLDFALLIKTIKDLKDKRALRNELEDQKKEAESADPESPLTQAVLHSYGKVKRNVITKYVNVVNSIIGIVGRLVTILSGGVGAIVGESLTILKNFVSIAQKAYRTGKGIYKYIRGTKGKGRAASAKTFLTEAAEGNLKAARILQTMDLWGKVQKAKGIKGEETRKGNAILEKIAGQAKTGPAGTRRITEILETEYLPAPIGVKGVVEEKVAGDLKSS